MILLSHSDRFNYSRLPNLDGLERYVEHRIPVGDFLTAVLSNDLATAVAHADDQNIWLIPIYMMWLFNEAPSQCHGSREKVAAWLKRES